MEEIIVYTIGYEGQHNVKDFLQKVVDKYQIQAIVDVRRNPVSRKNGFDCFGLNLVCQDMSVVYYTLIELGVPREYRKRIEQYDYRNKVLQSRAFGLLRDIIERYKRVVLLCYEKDYTMCHRSILASTLNESYGYKIEHIILE